MEYYRTEYGFAYGNEEEIPVGRITMRHLADGTIVIDHTYVAPQMRGRSIAGRLVMLVVQEAQREGCLIKPLCSYARSFLSKDEKLSALIAP
ncbi:MAG: GNAT family N-acetyltransferase [Sphaerochaeta sp.]|jgi:hypothetical protein|uniref:GNAT family N-acetyltransferase n=1 Tax=Sphaerochaeta sp. TaxID=1972642 RepID=UPI002FC89727